MSLYATTAQIKAALRVTDNLDDSLIGMAGSAASELIDAYCGRTFGQSAGTVTRYYSAHKSNHVEIDDMAAAPVFVKYSANRDGNYDTTIDAANYTLLPSNGLIDGLAWPYTAIQTINTTTWTIAMADEPTVAVSGVWGFPTVPASIAQAAIIQASRIFKRLDSPLGVAGFGEFGAVKVSNSLDPDVMVLLNPYRKVRAAL
jgi:hypothetical protein